MQCGTALAIINTSILRAHTDIIMSNSRTTLTIFKDYVWTNTLKFLTVSATAVLYFLSYTSEHNCLFLLKYFVKTGNFIQRMSIININNVYHEIQVLFKVLGWFSSTFQGKFHFQGLVRTGLHFQVLFKPVWTLILTHSEHSFQTVTGEWKIQL